jgi:hypothetical protein
MIELDANTPLRLESPDVCMKDGVLHVDPAPTFPSLSVMHKGTQLPVAWSSTRPGQLVTDERWAVHAELDNQRRLRTEENRWRRDIAGLWDVACPSLTGPKTIAGLVLLMGAPNAVRGYYVDNELRELLGHLATLPPGKLTGFRDDESTLLDLALTHGHWSLASRLWEQGVRGSADPEVQSGTLSGLMQLASLSPLQAKTLALDEPGVSSPDRTGLAELWLSRAQEMGLFDGFSEKTTSRTWEDWQVRGFCPASLPRFQENLGVWCLYQLFRIKDTSFVEVWASNIAPVLPDIDLLEMADIQSVHSPVMEFLRLTEVLERQGHPAHETAALQDLLDRNRLMHVLPDAASPSRNKGPRL